MENENVKKVVKKRYSEIAKGCGCCNAFCSGVNNREVSKSIGYSDKEMDTVPEANMGLGCGNPTALGEIKKGDIVVDLGSGAGWCSRIAGW